MSISRRGFLGLLGASAAAVPFLSRALPLQAELPETVAAGDSLKWPAIEGYSYTIWDGDAICNRALTDAEVAEVIAKLRNRWGI